MFTKVLLPYDKDVLSISIPSSQVAGVLIPAEYHGSSMENEAYIVLKALMNPIGTPRLSQLAKNKKNIVVITSDHTRPVPSHITLPLILQEIRLGNPDADITILIATGLHRGMTKSEMLDKFGKEICEKEHLVNHDAYIKEQFTNLGTLPSGSKCEINNIAVNADLLVAEGFIEPHFFAGFSGGRKSVLPGVASQDCVNINHSAPAMAHPLAATGILDGNPIHEDMAVAAKLAKLAFICNVLLDDKKHITSAFCGEYTQAHRIGCDLLLDTSGVDPIPADIVITTNGGYPLDQNLYQCPKGLDSALACVKEHGVIILVAACKDGLGGDNFGKMMVEGNPKELLERILAIPPEKTISEQWCVQRFADALQKYHIILVSTGIDKPTTELMNFIWAESVEEAIDKAQEITGNMGKITVIPDGVSVIIRRNGNE